MLLFNPADYKPDFLDDASSASMTDLVGFFEAKGLAEMKSEYHAGTWYTDFLEFNAEQGLFAGVATPANVGALLDGTPATRWDTARINELNEILGFYSLGHWYAWQVSMLGLGPVWTSANEGARRLVGELLRDGGIFGFGLSERAHGADIYSTDMILTRTPSADGWVANGGKYYIGNGNEAARLSVFGKFADDDPDHPGEYVFFLADTKHPSYELVKNTVHGQMFVAEFALHDAPVTEADLLHVGRPAWDAALATVNVGKVQLGWASIGIAEHSFYEAVAHANNRILYGQRVTTFPHVRRMLADSYARLLAMKMYAARSADYLRAASAEDRRFLLYNPIMKMKVTSEGERVVNLLWEVIAARGFEKDTYFESAVSEIRALPKLEGTVHVNLALVLKFLPKYMAAAAGAPGTYEPVGVRREVGDDAYLFAQGPASGLGTIEFHDPRPAFARFAHLPNVATFTEQVMALGALLMTSPPSKAQSKDLDFLLTLGQLFTQVVYAQLVAEAADLALSEDTEGARPGSVSDLRDLTEAHVDRMFAVFVQDVAEFAVALHGQPAATQAQQSGALSLIKRPSLPAEAEDAFVAEVLSYDGAWTMTP
ncbi:MAG: acyl-CoA dehydrogenase [Candidatus Nanopelagicales bacterium]